MLPFLTLQANEEKILDDSLTNVQWLYHLRSNKLLENKVKSHLRSHAKEVTNPYQKPQYSYATLIVLAINSSKDKRLTLQGIYNWIQDNFPYYKHTKKAWKVSK